MQTLLPPLRDQQDRMPAWLCPRCGGEQYHWDEGGSWRGRTICACCLSQMEHEKERYL